MTQVMTDLWPYLVTALFAAVGWQFRESYLLKTKVAVMEKTIETLQSTMLTTTESIKESITSIQNRLNSHSTKQDDMKNLLTDFKMEMLKEVGRMSANVSGLASDVKNLSNLISITDVGLRVDTSVEHKKK